MIMVAKQAAFDVRWGLGGVLAVVRLVFAAGFHFHALEGCRCLRLVWRVWSMQTGQKRCCGCHGCLLFGNSALG